MVIYDAKIEGYYEQLGIDTQKPTFSWKSRCKQREYRIIVAQTIEELIKETDLVFDSGRIISTSHIGIAYEGNSLVDIQPYYWKIIVWDNEGIKHVSEILSFTTGILKNPVTLGKWISNSCKKPFIARKEYKTGDKEIKDAYAFITGLGHFEIKINGKKVGDHQFDPGWTNYDRKIQYLMFDIKTYLRSENIISIEVGNGWYIAEKERYHFKLPGFMPPNPNDYKPFGEYLACNSLIFIRFTDGRTEVISTDESWKVDSSPILLANVYGSEIYDARKEQNEYSVSGFNDYKWKNATILKDDESPKGRLVVQKEPPTVITKTYDEPIYREIEEGAVLVDFGQNMSGLFEFTFTGAKSGDIIDMFPAEKLDENGNVDQMAKGWMMIDTYSTYIAKGVEIEKYCPKFAYTAGRFVLVKGVSIDQGNKKYPTLSEARAHFTTSKAEQVGVFKTSDHRLEQINHLVEMAVSCNLNNGIHSDCTQIEKFAWLEPNHLMAPSIMYYKNVNDLWIKIFDDMRTDQWTSQDWGLDYEGNRFTFGEGLIPSQAPCYVKNLIPVSGMGSFYDIIPWGSAIILAVYWHYQFYGNIKIIDDNYDAAMRYLEYQKGKVNAEGFVNHGLGDWGNPDSSAFARENIETAFLFADAKIMSEFAAILKKEEDALSLQLYADKVKKHYNSLLLMKHPEHDFYCYKIYEENENIRFNQACQALPLYWGMVPEDKKEDVVKALRWALESEGKLVIGEVGQPYVLQVMRDNGMNDLILEFILKKEHPSYYAFVLDGETTLGEYWEENPRSHCHDMMGHIMEWFYNGMLGIRQLEPGFGKVLIKPWISKNIEWVEGSYESVSGKISVKIVQKADYIEISLDINPNIEYFLDTSLIEESLGKCIILNEQKFLL